MLNANFFKNKLPYYAAIFSAVVSCWNFYFDLFFTVVTEGHYFLRYMLGLFNLGFLFSREFLGISGVNYANAIFDVLLLLGSVLYLATRGRETRLFRTGWAIILFSNTLSLFYKVCWLYYNNQYVKESALNVLGEIFSFGYAIALIYFGYRLLQYFKHEKALEEEVYHSNDTTLVYSVEATRGQRITHALLDGLLTILIFSPPIEGIIYVVNRNDPGSFSDVENGKLMLVLLFAFCRLLYYLFFETLLAATPAKMMTETRVTDNDGHTPSFGRVLGRTAARFTPLEGLSVLMNAGWHDRWSSTSVVQEKRTGKPGGYYYYLPPAIFGVIVLCSVASKSLEEYRIKRSEQHRAKNYMSDLQQKVSNLRKNDFLMLERINNNTAGDYESETSNKKGSKFLLAEEVRPDSVLFTLIKVYQETYHLPGQMEAEQAYQAGHDTLRRITLAKRDLPAALLGKHESYVTDSEAKIKGIKINGTLHAIKSAGTFYKPNIALAERSGWGSNYLAIGLENTGRPAKVTKIDVLEGDAEFTTPLPVRMEATPNSSSSVMLEAKADGNYADFKVNITVQDNTGQNQVYQITCQSGEHGTRSIQKLK